MIVVRFKMQSRADKVDQLRSLLADVAVASQSVEGVVSFDIGQDLTDSNSFGCGSSGVTSAWVS
jgi:quinol monooxygenase YgiN